MKKKIFLSIIVIFLLAVLILSFLKLFDIQSNNRNLKKQTTVIQNNIKDINSKSESFKEEIASLKEQAKSKFEEKEIWEKAKDKLEEAM